VFVQQVLDFTPLDVGWLLLAGNIAYGVAVMLAGRLADRMSPSLLTVAGLVLFALAFFWFAEVNETVGVGLLVVLMSLRLTSFGVVGPPNNLTAMRALPEEHVVMASGVFSLVRSISGTLGAAVSVTIFEQRYFYHVQRYIEDNDVTAFGLQEALVAVQHLLTWAGELPSMLAVQTTALVHQRLLAEATTMAYQDYFLLSALIGVLAILPALPWEEGWRATRVWLSGRRAIDVPVPSHRPVAVAVPGAGSGGREDRETERGRDGERA
jgi:MFS family permease